MINQPQFQGARLEDNVRNERYWRIGWAIMHMTYWQRLRWALTGRHEFMTMKYWEAQDKIIRNTRQSYRPPEIHAYRGTV